MRRGVWRDRARRGVRTGALAALVCLLGQECAHATLGVTPLPDRLLEDLTLFLPPSVLGRMLGFLSFQAKPLAFVAIVFVLVSVGAIVGMVIVRPPGSSRLRTFGRGAVYGVACWFLLTTLLVMVEGGPRVGSDAERGWHPETVVLLLSCLAFGVVAVAVPALEVDPRQRSKRRMLVGTWTIGVAVVGIAWLSYRLFGGLRLAAPHMDNGDVSAIGPWNIPGMPAEVTPSQQFYVVSKNMSDPELNASQWSLEVSGTADRPYTLGFEQLRALPFEDRYQTLECISNEVGGTLISTAYWRGVRLTDLLEAALPRAATEVIVFRSADGYAESIPLGSAAQRSVLVAYAMNGLDLEPVHGGPARLLVPGAYGMKSVKWLTRIELADHLAAGYWEQRGWSDGTMVKTMCQIRSVSGTHPQVPRGPAMLGGIAYAGDREIKRVEVSTDAGRTWSDALLKETLSRYTWCLWRLPWLAEPGHYAVVVRATDSRGAVQTPDITDALPTGASGWDAEPAEVV